MLMRKTTESRITSKLWDTYKLIENNFYENEFSQYDDIKYNGGDTSDYKKIKFSYDGVNS